MVVVAIGGGAGAGAHSGWGTWEELVLGSAVLRHGGAAWAAVADELRSRSPCVFSPEECEAKFAEIQSRYSACNAWFEELRKQRVAELKRELEMSESSIGSLQFLIENLSNSKRVDMSSDCRATHTESCSLSGNIADNNLSSKELSRDRSSMASFTEEATQCQKSQQVQQCYTESIQTNKTSTESFLKAIDEKVCTKDGMFWGSRKQRGRRARMITLKADASNGDGEPTSTSCIDRNGSSECCKEDMKKGLNLKSSNAEPDAMKKGLNGMVKKGLTSSSVESGVMKKGFKASKLESGVMKNRLKSPKGESGVSVIEGEKANLGNILGNILKFISSQVDSLMLQRQVDAQRKRMTYKKMIRQHMDFRILHSKIENGAISSIKELLRDILLFVNNVIAFYPKGTLERMAAIQLRDLACKTVNESANCVSKALSAPLVKKNAQSMHPGRHSPGDVNENKVPLRDTTISSMQTVQKTEPANNRGVGRPPNTGRLKGSTLAQEDRNSRGRKRLQR